MDSSALNGWKHRNYVFDNTLNRYILQHRTTNERSHDTVSSRAHADEIDAVHPTSIDRTDAMNVHIRHNPSADNQQRNKHNKRQWVTNYKTTKFSAVTLPNAMNLSDNKPNSHSNISTPTFSNNQYVILTQHNTNLIVCNWYRVFYPEPQQERSQSLHYLHRRSTDRCIIVALLSYSIQRFEFDEHHRLIQTWVNYDVLMDDDSSVDSYDIYSKRVKKTPIELHKSITSSNDDEEVHCPSDDSLSISIDPPLLNLSPTVSYSQSLSRNVSSPAALSQHNHFECIASLPSVKWSTIFFGAVLDSSLVHKNVYVCNVKVDKLGYGAGFAFFGHNKHDFDGYHNIFYDENKLNHFIQDKYNGYPDVVSDCFTIYDDGECCDWHVKNAANKLNVNSLTKGYNRNTKRNEKNSIKLISKLSKVKLKTRKSTNTVFVPNEEDIPSIANAPRMMCSKSKKEFYCNKKKRLTNRKKSRSDVSTLKKRNFYGAKRRKKPKKVSEKFCFDEKSDVIQISVDLYHKKISIHNLNNHRCVIIKDFNYEQLRIAFVLRYSNITVIDQKWI